MQSPEFKPQYFKKPIHNAHIHSYIYIYTHTYTHIYIYMNRKLDGVDPCESEGREPISAKGRRAMS
jgi:hypothetical protein